MFREDFPFLNSSLYFNTAYVGLMSKSLFNYRHKIELKYLNTGDQFKIDANGKINFIQKSISNYIGSKKNNTFFVPNFSFGIRIVLDRIWDEAKVLTIAEEYPSILSALEERRFLIFKLNLSDKIEELIYDSIKKNVHLASIAGGTDLVSCFVLGNIYSPVYKGQIQNNGLGMNTDVFSDKGKSLINKKGELVCKSPFPSMPKLFWNDSNNKKYKKAYFKKFKNIWHHGDYAERKKNGGYVIYGRSDATLNPGGVRLGTAEIYSVVEKFKEVKESIVVSQTWDNDVRIILFLVLDVPNSLNDDFIEKLKKTIRSQASPRHVPSKIIEVSDIPRTKNGKIVDLAVKNIIEGNKIKNIQALANPNVLKQYKNLKQLKT